MGLSNLDFIPKIKETHSTCHLHLHDITGDRFCCTSTNTGYDVNSKSVIARFHTRSGPIKHILQEVSAGEGMKIEHVYL